jgi:hypothetical protein
MFKPCKQCQGNGFNLKKNKEGKEDKEICDACSGTGNGMVQITNTYTKQLAATLTTQNKVLQEIRDKSYEVFINLKKLR